MEYFPRGYDTPGRFSAILYGEKIFVSSYLLFVYQFLLGANSFLEYQKTIDKKAKSILYSATSSVYFPSNCWPIFIYSFSYKHDINVFKFIYLSAWQYASSSSTLQFNQMSVTPCHQSSLQRLNLMTINTLSLNLVRALLFPQHLNEIASRGKCL